MVSQKSAILLACGLVFFFKFTQKELVIEILTQTGSKTLNIKFKKTTEHFSAQIDLSGQAKGMYLINLSIDKFKAVRKILVE